MKTRRNFVLQVPLILLGLNCVGFSDSEEDSDPKAESNEPRFTLYQLPSQGPLQMMSYVMIAEVGKVVVIDGGNAIDGDYLKRFIATHSRNRVDTWIITHPHEDHLGALTWILSNRGGLIIDKICAAFPAMEWLQENEAGTAATLAAFNAVMDISGIDLVPLAPGDVLDVDEIHIEILSVDNPEITVNPVNNSSVSLQVSDSTKSIIFLGDLGYEGGDKLLTNVDHKKLKADYVQMAHHGNFGVTEALYQVVQPQYALWPTPLWLWNNDNGGGTDSGPWTTLKTRQWMDDLNVKSNYVSGLSGLIEIK